MTPYLEALHKKHVERRQRFLMSTITRQRSERELGELSARAKELADEEAKRQREERIQAKLEAEREPMVTVSRITVKLVVRTIAEAYGVSIEDLMSSSRRNKLAAARQHAAWFIKERRPEMSLPNIGRMLGGRDHSTILHAIRTWPRKAEKYPRQVEIVEREFRCSDDS